MGYVLLARLSVLGSMKVIRSLESANDLSLVATWVKLKQSLNDFSQLVRDRSLQSLREALR
jgi:hypothetical protein